jgi:CheY-like chemotaxis protein
MNGRMSNNPKEHFFVLIADDSESDRLLLKTAMQKATRLKIVAEATDGLQTIAYFKGHGPFGDREQFPLPDLLLLDLGMPKKDGFEVLEWLGTQPLEKLSVVVLTDSMQPEHLQRALDLGADFFQVKPHTFHDRQTMVLALEERLVKAVEPAVP